MATYRIGIGTEFKLDAGVGIGTATPGNGLGDLRVDGTYKTEDLDVLGVSTLSRYAGFAAEKINIDTSRDVTLTGEHQTIGDIDVGVNRSKEEVNKFIDLVFTVYKSFGFNTIIIKLSTRPEKRVGSDEIWDKSEKALEDSLNSKDCKLQRSN